MAKQHSVTPSPELVREWCEQLFSCPDEPEINAYELARLAAQYGADQELEVCVELLDIYSCPGKWIDLLRAARRPKPPTLKEPEPEPEPEFTAEEIEMIQAPWSYLSPAQQPEPAEPSDEEIRLMAVEWGHRSPVEFARAVLQRWGATTTEEDHASL